MGGKPNRTIGTQRCWTKRTAKRCKKHDTGTARKAATLEAQDLLNACTALDGNQREDAATGPESRLGYWFPIELLPDWGL